MDERPKCKCQNYKTIRRKHEINLHELGFGNEFQDTTPKTQQQRKYR